MQMLMRPKEYKNLLWNQGLQHPKTKTESNQLYYEFGFQLKIFVHLLFKNQIEHKN